MNSSDGILGEIKKGIDQHWSTAADKMKPEAAEIEQLHASLDIARPRRNATMHLEKKYTDDEAEHIFVGVKGFMKVLASRCDEEGNPKV